jgi:hypothetical protein
MNVGELIKILSTFDKDIEVITFSHGLSGREKKYQPFICMANISNGSIQKTYLVELTESLIEQGFTKEDLADKDAIKNLQKFLVL